MTNPFRYFKTSPEIIRLAVMLYVRYPLSLRQVEDLLFERGIDISHETVRFWWNRFGPLFAAEIRKRRVDHRCYSNWRWHLDEVFVRINGETHYLWRAVDHEGEVLEVFVTKRRDRRAALKFLKSMMKRYGRPWSIVTDGLRSYRAATKVVGVSDRQEIPDFSWRRDEVGDLSAALRAMTDSLYDRIDAIESFAADVAHELKNPLTSLKSAVETLPLAANDADRKRLIEITRHDVRRLDRLISDISDASRLDAELAREDAEPVDLENLLTTVVSVLNDTCKAGQPRIELTIQDVRGGEGGYTVSGHASRLGQVISNLLANARSFSPPGGHVRMIARRLDGEIEIRVEDEGPGIAPENLERIFNRFYTDRPDQDSFGQNSGLGLSISRQIVENHRGRIWAENIASDIYLAGAANGEGADAPPPPLARDKSKAATRIGRGRKKPAPPAQGNAGSGKTGARLIVRLPAA